jgi:hypothetical protein
VQFDMGQPHSPKNPQLPCLRISLSLLRRDASFAGSFRVANNRLALALVEAWAFWWMCAALSLLLMLLLKTSSADFET